MREQKECSCWSHFGSDEVTASHEGSAVEVEMVACCKRRPMQPVPDLAGAADDPIILVDPGASEVVDFPGCQLDPRLCSEGDDEGLHRLPHGGLGGDLWVVERFRSTEGEAMYGPCPEAMRPMIS